MNANPVAQEARPSIVYLSRMQQDRPHAVSRTRRIPRATVASLFACVASGFLGGCINAALRSAQTAIAAGDYTTAHQRLEAARNDPTLSANQRVEVADGLCLTEHKIGPPAYPVAEQLSICREAVNMGSTSSAAQIEEIAAAQRAIETDNINQAIAQNDLAAAVTAIGRYQKLPGADPHALSQWSKQLWELVDHQDADAAKQHQGVQPAISRAAREFPKVRAMNNHAFARWVEQSLRLDGGSLVSSIRVDPSELTLRLTKEQIPSAANNLDRFVKVNDALIAHCRCAGRTNVELQDSQLPAYLVRLDPATRQSEILVLVQR